MYYVLNKPVWLGQICLVVLKYLINSFIQFIHISYHRTSSKEFLPLSDAKKMRRKKKDREKEELKRRALENQGRNDFNNHKNRHHESRYSFNKPMLPPVS
jgi:hypothetical protein